MLIAASLRTLWLGLRFPSTATVASGRAALSVFAAAIMIVAATQTTVSYIEAGNEQLSSEARTSEIVQQLRSKNSTNGGAEVTAPPNSFTAQLGTVLITTVIGMALLAAVLMVLTRFLTNQPVTYPLALAAVSASQLIEVARLLLYLPLHLLGGSVRYGMHAGVFVSPEQHPFLFSWLVKIDPILWWQYVVMAISISVSANLHYKYGFVVGSVVYACMLATVGGIALVAFFSFQSL